MEAILEYWDRENFSSIRSIIKRTEAVTFDNEIELFEVFYKKNRRLDYCNGSYYKFQDKEFERKYGEWLKSDDYKKKSFALYYGGGIVD